MASLTLRITSSDKLWMRSVFMEWSRYVYRVQVEGLQMEEARLSALIGDEKEKPLSRMTRAELTEVARKEMGFTQRHCDTIPTVPLLRRQIQIHRQMMSANEDPMLKLPKFKNMKLAELKAHHAERGLPPLPVCRNLRIDYEQSIRDDVKRRQFDHRQMHDNWTTVTAPTTRTIGSTEMAMDVEEEYTRVDIGTPRWKPRSKSNRATSSTAR